MEYILKKFTAQVEEEITIGSINLLMSHSLVQVHAAEWIKAAQVRLILEPLVIRLLSNFKSFERVEHRLKQILAILEENFFVSSPGYGYSNLTSLLQQYQFQRERLTSRKILSSQLMIFN